MIKDIMDAFPGSKPQYCLPIGSYATLRLDTDTGMAFGMLTDMRVLNELAACGWAVQCVLRQGEYCNVELLLKKVSDEPLPYRYGMTGYPTQGDELQNKDGIIGQSLAGKCDIVSYLRNYRDDCSLYLIRTDYRKETPDHE